MVVPAFQSAGVVIDFSKAFGMFIFGTLAWLYMEGYHINLKRGSSLLYSPYSVLKIEIKRGPQCIES